jgi:hypothetical protein
MSTLDALQHLIYTWAEPTAHSWDSSSGDFANAHLQVAKVRLKRTYAMPSHRARQKSLRKPLPVDYLPCPLLPFSENVLLSVQ